MSASILRMTEAHLASVAELEALCFAQPWSENALRLLLGEEAVGFVCVDGEAVLAYGGMLYAPDEGQITNIATHPDARRCGYAKLLLERLLQAARERGAEQVSLEVRVSNVPAIALYEAAGFYRAGVRRRFYRDPCEDAYVMLKTLKED